MGYDRTDAHILKIVQKNNRLTSEAIGELAGLSATACQRRLKRLRSEGSIEADVSIVSPKAVETPIEMFVLVTLERERSDIIDRFKKAIKSSVEVVNGFYVTGDARTLPCTRPPVSWKIIRSSLGASSMRTRTLEGFKTMGVLDRVKAGLAILETPSG